MARKGDDSPINWSVQEFLERFKTALQLGLVEWHEIGRRNDELLVLQVTRNEVLAALQCLESSAHYRGPEPDDSTPQFESALHIFKHVLEGKSIYVKISVIRYPKKKNLCMARIWSFKVWS